MKAEFPEEELRRSIVNGVYLRETEHENFFNDEGLLSIYSNGKQLPKLGQKTGKGDLTSLIPLMEQDPIGSVFVNLLNWTSNFLERR